MSNETAYPLSWPTGWKRTAAATRSRARFAKASWQSESKRPQPLTVSQAVDRVVLELERLGGRNWILSTNVETRLDGTPRSDRRAPDDPGAALYFTLQGKKTSLACDKWDRVADNIASLAAHIECLRGIERYGVGTLEQAFRGYQALPAPGFTHSWREILSDCKSLDEAESQYRERAKRLHPDVGGDQTQMAELNMAIHDARIELAERQSA